MLMGVIGIGRRISSVIQFVASCMNNNSVEYRSDVSEYRLHGLVGDVVTVTGGE